MATAILELYTSYRTFLDENVDPRVKEYPLVNNPLPLFGLLIVYILFVTDWGPSYMKNRQPFGLKREMIIYNALQVAVNAWIVHVALVKIWLSGTYNWFCEGPDFSEEELPLMMVKMVYIYYLTKIADLTDTVFMVLRKKDRQISFLHKYHHVGMCLAGWIGTAFVGGGSHVVLFGTLNCIVHTIMYGYYLLAIVKPEYTISSFKRRITELQLLQFAIIFFHGVSGFFMTECTFPKWALSILIPQDVFMFVLFWDFYVKTYLKPKAKATNGKAD